ncbi:uncharacterized protein Z520_02455 [Fonsecaea multimorphosa CBS 102226]|uniref:Mitochondrial distribution and morphology protein 12 n=1 Tax=Fonsecaea multimorphosa CBS 102226 TaxID=1442371 RepID=A0A0D2IZ41_9EURO|nr:uncharacterized protein Z520_02455 [Fonsecaea multimorphosa CBS 102226]KIY02317.1 hypothetical protein Z520_02455 [Fonsecaea multimorphosa CBS 102226]OAL28962.1 hypothetical protein AYO22_02398 [Fonsecaea multimorphosa]
MSVDIGWEKITSGPDGAALAEKIRAFVHDKFQQIPLPRFINAVHVHSFELGSVCPEIEIKDICDPLPDFYEDEEDDEDDEEGAEGDVDTSAIGSAQNDGAETMNQYVPQESASSSHQPRSVPQLSNIITGSGNGHFNALASIKEGLSAGDEAFAGPFPRSTTPGIPGGTSNLSYFHFPGGGLSGTQTPLAAVASGTPFSPRPWSHDPSHNFSLTHQTPIHGPTHIKPSGQDTTGHDDPSTRPSTANSISSPRGSESTPSSPQLPHRAQPAGESGQGDTALDALTPLSASRLQSRQVSDLQVVTRVKYAGDVRMTLTAEILLDYPMPSFVGIPLKLAITGLTFDGVAIVAWVKKKMHFCFLDSEDAAALVGESVANDRRKKAGSTTGSGTGLPGPLQEIHVESEIGRQEDGKQVLKNVGKVEKFVLEEVRKIFEEEFVFPSYWTFLV